MTTTSIKNNSGQSKEMDAHALHDEDNYYSEIELRLKYFLAGGIAGAVSRTATAPLDRIRVLLQTSTFTSTTSLTYSGGFKYALYKIYESGGLTSFYRGNGLNVIKIFPESALKFLVFEHVKSLISDYKHEKYGDDTIGVTDRLISGGCAGLVSQFVIYPLETLKIRVMAEIGQNKGRVDAASCAKISKSDNVMSTLKSIYRQGGVAGFYRGLIPSLMGIIPYAGIDLTVFETLKVAFSNEDSGVISTLVFGMVSGTVGATALYPVSVIRTRLQAQGTLSHPQTYRSVFHCIGTTWKRESLRGFYRGLTPTLMKVVPSVAISYAVYDTLKGMMNV